MIAAFEGWNDAGDAASAAVEHLALSWDAEPYLEIDPEPFYDFQVNRPYTEVVEGATRPISWATTTISRCHPPAAGRDVLLLHGIEPNLKWRTFARELVRIVDAAEVATVVCLGALLADVAHTRPVSVSGSAGDPAMLTAAGIAPSTYAGPTGITGVWTDALTAAGVPSASLWAAVPHYISEPPSPKATLALLRGLEEIIDVEMPVASLVEQADEWVTEVSRLAAEDPQIEEYVRALADRDDEDEPIRPVSGDLLAKEFERYLRRRR